MPEHQDSDHDLLVRLDEKMGSVIIGIDKNTKTLEHKADKDDVREIVATAVRPLKDELKRTVTRVELVEKSADDWRKTKRFFMGAGAVLTFVWSILWAILFQYLSTNFI